MKRDHSLVISQSIWDLVELSTDEEKLLGWRLETFNNCYEQGLVAINYEKHMVIWTYANRKTDLPTLIISTIEHMTINRMFDDEALKKAESYLNTQLAALAISTYIESL